MHSAPFNSRNNWVFSDMLFIKVSKFTELQITRKPNITPITIYREYHRVTLITDILNITTFQTGLFLPICWRYLQF